MIVKPLRAGLAALSLTASSFAQAPAPAAEAFSADAFRAHVTFLADDLLEGRDTGSRARIFNPLLLVGIEKASTHFGSLRCAKVADRET